MKQYCKLVKFNQKDKLRKAVEEICRPRRKAQLRASLSLKSKMFFPKAKRVSSQFEVDQAVVNRKYSQGNPILDTSLEL